MGLFISQSGNEIEDSDLIGWEMYPLQDEFVYFDPKKVDEYDVFGAMVEAENGDSTKLFALGGVDINNDSISKKSSVKTKSSPESISRSVKMK